MQNPNNSGLWWAVIAVWCIVNAVNLLQGFGFLSRVRTRSMTLNHKLGYVMIALSLPAAAALIAFIRAGAGWLQWTGLLVYLAFILLMVMVDYLRPVEFRAPVRYTILVPYLVLFFGSILLMGLPMYNLNQLLWLVTAASSIFLLISMGIAMRKGVG